MAKKTVKKLKEDALVNEMQPQEVPAAQPATSSEIANAATAANNAVQAEPQVATGEPVEATVVDQPIATEEEPIISTPQELGAPADPFTPPAPGMIPSGWVKPEDLASALAQETGDMEVASTADDGMVTEQPVPTDDAIDQYQDDQSGIVPTPEEEEVIMEYRKFKASQGKKLVEESDPITGTDLSPVEDVADQIDEIVDNADDVEVNYDISEIDDMINDDEEVDLNDDLEVEINDDLMATVNDFLNELNDNDTVADTLQDTADFFNDLVGIVDEEDEEETDEETDDANEEIIEDEDDVDEVAEDLDVEEIADEEVDDIEEVDEDEEEIVEGLEEHLIKSIGYENLCKKIMESISTKTKATIYRNIIDSPSTLKEQFDKVIYPAGSQPVSNPTSGTFVAKTENPQNTIQNTQEPRTITTANSLVRNYEKNRQAKKRREALREYRHKVQCVEDRRDRRDSRFNSALGTSTKLEEKKVTPKDKTSWASNKFLDKYSESKEFSFQKLLEEGFLG